MNRRNLSALSILAGTLISIALTGCDTPPAPPKNEEGRRPSVVIVPSSNSAEQQLVTAFEMARADYKYRLRVIQGYYERIGNMDKLIWTRNEMANLEQAKTFDWEGIPPVSEPTGESIGDADERVLAEYVAMARQNYLRATNDLVNFYEDKTGQEFKLRLVRNMQDRFDPVRTYRYFLGAEIPPVELRPNEVFPQADALFEEGVNLHEKGKGILRFALTTNYDLQRQALLKFLELIDRYPTSNKAPLSAYYIGEIYKEYFNEDLRAVQWYQRAWTWDPYITKPARFQAGTVYDLRLKNYAKAVECYKGAIQHEQFNQSNVRFARERIEKLTGK